MYTFIVIGVHWNMHAGGYAIQHLVWLIKIFVLSADDDSFSEK
jgi:hypothetical protein